MMIGHPTVDVPPSPWPLLEDQTDEVYSSFSPHNDIVAALGRYLPSNHQDPESDSEPDAPVDAYTCDHFRMYEFKVRRCPRGRSHDWTECPYAHPGEKARRRDPRKFHYSGTACPDFRKGSCRKGDACEYAHGVFECWLHPARYRTQPCKDGVTCRRRVCFFAHTPDQLRLITQQSPKGVVATDFYDMSPLKQSIESKGHPFLTSPTSASPDESPPVSPMTRPTQLLSRSLGSSSINDVMASLRSLQLGKVNPMASSSWIGYSSLGSPLRPGFGSVPTTPTRPYLDFQDRACEEEDPVMERVESGRDLRARMFEKLSKENSFSRAKPEPSSGADVGWVSELVK